MKLDSVQEASFRARLFDVLTASTVFVIVFALHARWVLTHFSSDAYLLDSGWLAYLFASADPTLHNPTAINSLSFYAFHLSPHIYLFGAPLSRLLHLSGTSILAVHAGFFFGLFFLSLYLMVAAGQLQWRRKLIAATIAVSLGVFSNVLLQAAAYPHFEIAIIALSSLAISAWTGGYPGVFAICLLWLPLIREDGGLYAAFVCLACLALDYRRASGFPRHARVLLSVAGAGVLATAIAFAVHARYFPGFDAFSNNFAGHSWDHVSFALLARRSSAMMTSLNTAPVLVGCIVLAFFDIRYAIGLFLLSPLFVLHLLAVRDEHGYFTLYFALPWMLPCTLWLAVLVKRFGSVSVRTTELVLVLGLALVGTAPVQAAVGAQSQFWYIAEWAVRRPVVNIHDMQDYALWVRGSSRPAESPQARPRNCVSMGIAALIPNQVRPDEVLEPDDTLASCDTVLLMRGDMSYAAVVERAQAMRFKSVATKENAELWLR